MKATDKRSSNPHYVFDGNWMQLILGISYHGNHIKDIVTDIAGMYNGVSCLYTTIKR